MSVVIFTARPIGYKVPGANSTVNKFALNTANAPSVYSSSPGSPITAQESSCIYTLTSNHELIAGATDKDNSLMSFKLVLEYNNDTANYLISTQVIDSIDKLKGVEIISELSFSVIDTGAHMIRRVNSIGVCEAVAARWSPVAIEHAAKATEREHPGTPIGGARGMIDSGEDLGDVCTSYIKSSN
ncbi:hypothetical protein KEN49_CDS0201 [Pseudomonas phage vB_Pae3705-KEN49]